ncbi:PepSY domain-containing protein [Parendozoicomonas haliclonae]|uniref:PepSY domain-containing protein n=1 Tax=Parendozoicomonas haliclonae TaxID=1960125 RepID=A0A1X7AF90_9GAMM|nr:PepSY domain-containing protein [Parendozoicomonas haliclonae]SMA35189.1 hypothetical protein EHSB41UT_00502 [Parendozoicomonas haliclonae]
MKQLLLALLIFCLPLAAQARDYDLDSHKAREAVDKGDAVSYDVLESSIRQRFYGRIIRVEMEKDDGIWIYELRLLQDDGRVVEMELNARTLQVLEIEGRSLETVVKAL